MSTVRAARYDGGELVAVRLGHGLGFLAGYGGLGCGLGLWQIGSTIEEGAKGEHAEEVLVACGAIGEVSSWMIGFEQRSSQAALWVDEIDGGDGMVKP
ncbi:hypothetical protein M0R45_006608 [Rubus argutus]|uniref:Uncharacterized protein n=1 Tax=Rubus argutus TaxID=59490 RepID=A0AAW1YRD8_RUBAR